MASPALFAALAVLAQARTLNPSVVARGVMADYRNSFLTRNSDIIVKKATPDFIFVNLQGQVALRGPALARIKQGLTMYEKVVRFDQKLVSAKRVKEGVLVIVDTYLEMTIDNHGKPGRVVTSLRGETLLVPRGKGWAYRRVRALKELTTMPGGSMLDTRP